MDNGRHTILLIDDEPMNLEMLETFFEERYDVLTAGDGLEALELLRSMDDPGVIHCIISDQRMPGMTGVRFFEQSLSLVPATRRILLTAYTDIDAIIDSINRAQIHTFAQKPVDLFNFAMIVERALEAWELHDRNERLTAELKAMNESLERLVAERTAELQRTVSELEVANDVRNKMLAVLSHDLANPFSGLLGSAQMLVDSRGVLSDAQQHELTRMLYSSASRIFDMLQDLLRWASVQLGRAEANVEPVECAALVDGAVGPIRAAADSKKLELRTRADEGLHALADAELVKSIIRNLLVNAIKFTPKGGWIEVSATRADDGEHVVFAVRDNGVGMETEKFERLFRSGASPSTRGTDDEKGTGLGLLLCHEFARLSGGTIQVESALGEGSTFSVTLPIATGA